MSETLNLARYKKGNDVFEIVVNPDQAMNARRNPEANIRDAVVYPKIYSDAKKGLLASEQKIQEVFGTTDELTVAREIIKRGEIQVSAEYRKQKIEQKKRRIIELIHKQGVDPRTNAPHPQQRIEAAIEQTKIKIDDNEQAETQVPAVLKALMPILPIKLVRKEIQVTIPAQYAPKAHPLLKSFGKIHKERWEADGSWTGQIEIPGGLETEFYDKLNKLTHGHAQAVIINTTGEKYE